MSHRCQIEESSIVCYEEKNELWVKEYNGVLRQNEGRTYRVNFCPECGFKIPKASFAKSYFGCFNIPDVTPNDSITQFSQALSTAIAQMNHNVELIKAMMSAQNTQNQCFMDRDLATSQELAYLKRRLQILEEK